MTRPRIIFLFREKEHCLQNDIVAIAEGLEQLGIPFYARANYWRRSPARRKMTSARPLPRYAPTIATYWSSPMLGSSGISWVTAPRRREFRP